MLVGDYDGAVAIRMSRAERQVHTRAELLDAARHRFLECGYAATSLEQIADDAGYSKGAVYSNFTDKASLCREVLTVVQSDKLNEIATIVGDASTLEDLQVGLERWMEVTIGDVGWTMLEMEFSLVSRGNPQLTQMITSMHAGMRDTIVEMIRHAGVHLGVGDVPETKAREVAGMIVATLFGLGVQRAVNPSTSIAPGAAIIRIAFAELLAEVQNDA